MPNLAALSPPDLRGAADVLKRLVEPATLGDPRRAVHPASDALSQLHGGEYIRANQLRALAGTTTQPR
jgi:hypothetical protein